jgi:hypothetical protein
MEGGELDGGVEEWTAHQSGEPGQGDGTVDADHQPLLPWEAAGELGKEALELPKDGPTVFILLLRYRAVSIADDQLETVAHILK